MGEAESSSGRILYLNGQVAVVNKRIGENCENNPKSPELSLSARVRPELEGRLGRALPEIEAAHRIDQPVSGCVILALDHKTLPVLFAQFAEGTVHKRYWAIVEKPESGLASRGGRLEHMIRFDPKRQKATAVESGEVRKPGPEWKKAILSWKLLGEGERYLFLEIEPETGRTHQIRAQLAVVGMKIKGDLKYGAKRSDPLGGIRLHSRAVQFRDPVTGDSVLVTAPVGNPDPLWRAFEDCAGNFATP